MRSMGFIGKLAASLMATTGMLQPHQQYQPIPTKGQAKRHKFKPKFAKAEGHAQPGSGRTPQDNARIDAAIAKRERKNQRRLELSQ